MLLLVLLLAILAFVSFCQPSLVPFWEERGPAVMAHLDEGRYRDALKAAMAPDKAGTKDTRWTRSEPLGEAPPAAVSGEGEDAPTPVPGTGPVEPTEAAPAGATETAQPDSTQP
jgi:hypothetical protein